MAAVAKLPATKQFKRGMKGGLTPSDPARVEAVIPFSPFLNGDAQTSPPDEIIPPAGMSAALASVLANDMQGCSAIAAALHCQAVLYADPESGATVVPSTQEATSQYVMICGPGDVGGDLLHVLEWWRAKGLKCGGVMKKIEAYARLTRGDRRELSLAAASLRGALIGLNLKRKWYEDAGPGFVWDATDTADAAQIAVAVVGYSSQGIVISWAGLIGTLTWAAYTAPGVTLEAYAVFGEQWSQAEQLEEMGIALEELTSAIAAVSKGQPPVIPAAKPAAEVTGPPSPAPATASTFRGSAVVEIGGQSITVPMSGTLDGAAIHVAAPTPDMIALLAAAAALLHTARQGQWALAAVHLAELLDSAEALPSAEDQEQWLVDVAVALDAERGDAESD